MRNYSYRATSSDWTKLYDASVTGDFNGFIQSVNGFPASIIVSATTPTPSDVGVLIDDDPTNITIRASDSENLYARIQNNGNASVLSMLTMPWLIVGGASPDHSEPTENPVGISGIDGSGLKRSLLTDSIGQMMTTEQDSEVFTASASSASVLFTADMTNWRSVLLQVTSAGTSCTISYECSNDQSVWTLVLGSLTNYGSASTLGAVVANSSTTATQLQFPKRAKYFRARVSVYGSGTVSVAYALSLEDVPSPTAAAIWGQVAEGSAAGGNPVTIGVECRTSNKTSVGNGQIVRPIGTVDGKMIIRQHSIPENEWNYAAASGGILNTTTAVTIKAAAGAPYRNYLTSIQVQAEALANATELAVRDGAGGTVLWRIKIPTTGLDLKQVDFADPLKSSSATLLEVVTLTASGTGAVYVNAQGYVAP
jgi:hypothetical protein